jgi:Lhr-like helicase
VNQPSISIQGHETNVPPSKSSADSGGLGWVVIFAGQTWKIIRRCRSQIYLNRRIQRRPRILEWNLEKVEAPELKIRMCRFAKGLRRQIVQTFLLKGIPGLVPERPEWN